jgi:NADPH-dependent 2,4-dienoyl-CoA reductase/sulfur reductase-like enzyme
MRETDLAIIGAGPAGLAAAAVAARAGVHVTLVDESPYLGGQFLKGADLRDHIGPVSKTEQQARELLDGMADLGVDFLPQTVVWAVDGSRLALVGPEGSTWLQAKTAITAPGARERVLPFPGWTLPGVMALGGIQILVKAHGVLPGKKVLLAGSGPLLLATAEQLSRKGAQVVAVLEAAHIIRWPRFAGNVWGNWDRLREGSYYFREILRRGVPYRTGYTVSRVFGQDRVEGVSITHLDMRGNPIPSSQYEVAVDAVGIGFGLIPNTELTRLWGCEHEYDSSKGGWVPVVNKTMETSVPGVFAAGELVGSAGAQAALITGQIAGLAAATRLGYLHPSTLSGALRDQSLPLLRAQRFGKMLNGLFAPQSGLDSLAKNDTILCRCEDVSVGQVKTAIQLGLTNLNSLKNGLRVGQGLCQGRTCGPLLSRLIAKETGKSPAEAGVLKIRPPLKPVALGALAGE